MKTIIRYKDFVLKVQVTKDCTTIYDSRKVKNFWDMRVIIHHIKSRASAKMAINKRNTNSMINEWRVHNLLYTLGIMRSRTSSVDLNVNQPWYIKTLYAIISPFYFHYS